MQIIGIPAKNINSASTRLRYYYILKHLPKECSFKTYSGKLAGDILYVQNNADTKTVKIAKKAKKRNIPIVFDIDDPVKHKRNQSGMLKLADTVTTDTKQRAEYLSKWNENVVVVPDLVDYDVKKPIEIRENIRKIVSFGNNSSLMKCLPYMKNIQNCACYYIGNKFQGIKFIKWKLKTFVKTMSRFDVAVLAHGYNFVGDMKSNNRLLVTMSMGMPTITTKTCAYYETLKDVGYEYLAIDKPNEINRVIDEIKPQAVREKMAQTFIDYVKDNYSSEKTGMKLAHVFEKTIKKGESREV